jgi:hypothetical protein
MDGNLFPFWGLFVVFPGITGKIPTFAGNEKAEHVYGYARLLFTFFFFGFTLRKWRERVQISSGTP